MSLFRYSHPLEFEFFRSAITQDLKADEHDGVDEAKLLRALVQLPEVSVTRACPCGEPTCWTFSFGDGACECVQLLTPSEAVVLDFDDGGNLTGVEKVPRRAPPHM
jgi:hypothetical protein